MSQENVKKLPTIGFVEATKRGFKNLFNFKGRARRSEFWWFMLTIIVIWLMCVFVCLVSDFWSKPMGEIGEGEMVLHAALLFVLAIAPLLLTISSQVRRIHDVGKAGIVPILAGIAWLITAISFQIQLTYELASIRNDKIPGDRGIEISAIAFCVFILFAIMFLYYSLKDSVKTSNKYGDSPKYVG